MVDGKHYRNYECTENIPHISEKEWVKVLEFANKKIQVFKPVIDNRYSNTKVVSHAGSNGQLCEFKRRRFC